MSDDEKRGKLLSKLRKKKGMTQIELAELIHYSDKNISKWERGISFPSNPNVISSLAEIFGVSLEEIMYGELKQKKNDKAINENLKKTYINSYNKYLKIIRKFIMTTMLIVIVSLICIYFIFIKNSIYLYSANIENNKINSEKIFVLLTPKMNLLSFDRINTNYLSINKVVLYYVKDNRKITVFEGDNQNYYINEKYGYDEYNLKEIIKNKCYLKIVYSDETSEIIKINFKKDYNNDNIFPNNVPKISEDKNIIKSNFINKLLNNGFTNYNNVYTKEISDNIFCYYNYDSDIINILIENNDTLENISSNVSLNTFYYEKSVNGNIVESKTIYEEKKKNCDDSICSEIKDYAMYINYLKS